MPFKTISFSIHPAGWLLIGCFAVATLILGLFGPALFFLGLILTGWCVYFFRDPRRVTPVRPGLVVSPADGIVVSIRDVIPDPELGLGSERVMRVSIFLNVFDVHVNRIPAEGLVRKRHYRPGKFFNASLDKASVDNERLSLALELTGEHSFKGKRLGVVQIAGLVARRIVCDAAEGASYKTGEHYGIIRFGSRADVYLPAGMQPLVIVGQRMVGGETVIADASSSETPRQGDIR